MTTRANIEIETLNNRTRSIIFIKSLKLSEFECKQKIAELRKKGQIFSDKFLDQNQVPRHLGEVLA